MGATTLTDEQAWAMLRGAEDAWRARDAQALARVLHPDVRIVFNFDEPIRGVEAATAWIEERLQTQIGYVLCKDLRGIYNGDTVVSRWTGSWSDQAGHEYRGIGIELLTVDDQGLITNWEAVLRGEVL